MQKKHKEWFLDFLENHAGKTGKALRQMDWSHRPLGAIEFWPDSLKSSLSICLGAIDRAIAIYWHEPKNNDFYFFFNDHFEIITRSKKDPLGNYASKVWSEVWPVLKLQFDKIMAGEALAFKNTPFFLDREGLKEAYFDYNLIPIRLLDGRPGGIFNIAFEKTNCFLAERRDRAQKAIASHIITAKDEEEAAVLTMKSFAHFPEDVPIACIYLVNKNKNALYLANTVGIFSNDIPQSIDLNRRTSTEEIILKSVIQSIRGANLQIINGLHMQNSIWPEPIENMIVFRLSRHTVYNQDEAKLLGVLIMGLNPRVELSESYLAFLQGIASHTEQRIRNVRSQELAKEVVHLFQGAFESEEMQPHY